MQSCIKLIYCAIYLHDSWSVVNVVIKLELEMVSALQASVDDQLNCVIRV